MKDLDKTVQELLREKGESFVSGFLAYVVAVDRDKKAPDKALYDLLLMLNASHLSPHQHVKQILAGEIDSDIVHGFEFGKQYSQGINRVGDQIQTKHIRYISK